MGSLLGIGGLLLVPVPAAAQQTPDACSPNDIIPCGITDAQDMRAKIEANQPGDLPAIYGYYNIDPAEVTSRAVEGTAYRDGTVRVGDRVVATDLVSAGRSEKAYSDPVTIAGKTYHESAARDVFNSDSLEALVVLDDNQRFKYAILKDCGNPATGQAINPPDPAPAPAAPARAQTPQPPQPPAATPVRQTDETQQTREVCRDGEITTVSQQELQPSDEETSAETCQGQEPAAPAAAAPTKSQPELPSTGPAEMLAGAIGAGSVAGAGYYWRNSRRNLLHSVLRDRQ